MKHLIILALMLSACARNGSDGFDGQDGSNGNPGQTQTYKEEVLTLKAIKAAPAETAPLITYERDLGFVTVPQNIVLNVAHTSGSAGWTTIVLGDKTFCYQAVDALASASKRYNLISVRSGRDNTCTSGATTNVAWSYLQRIQEGDELQLIVHTPRVANGLEVEITLNNLYFVLQ